MPMKLPPGAELVDDSTSSSLPPGAVDVPDAAPSQDFSAGPQNTEGLFQMMGPQGTIKPVPYSRVMEASKAGYKIDPEARITYAKGREAELKKTGKKLDIATDLPQAYATVSAAPKAGTVPWFKQQGLNLREKALGLLPTAGGIAGGLGAGGAGIETGPGALATAAAGAAAGGVIGEDVRQTAEEHLHPYEQKMTPKQTALNLAGQGALQGASELTGRLGGKALAPAFKNFRDTAALSAKTGIPLLPSEAAGKAPSYIEKFLKGSVLTKGRMEQFRALQNAQTQSEVQKIASNISKFHGTSEDLGNLVQNGIDVHKEGFRATQKALYQAIRDQVGERTVKVPVHSQAATGLLDAAGRPIMKTVTTYRDRDAVVDRVMPSTVELKKFAEEGLKKLDQVEQILDPTLLSQSRKTFQRIVDAPDNLTYGAMDEARSDALSTVRDLDQALGGKQSGLATKMAKLFDEAIMDGAEKSGIPDLAKNIRAANAFTANEHRMFEQALVEKIVKLKRPEAIATLIRGRMVGNQELRDLFAVMPKELHPLVQQQILVDTMRQSTNRISKIFNERRFAETIGNIGDERGKIIFGKGWDNVVELAGLLEKVNGPTGLGGGTGAALQNLSVIKDIIATAAAPVTMAASGHLEGGTLLFVGEVVGFKTMANLMTHPALTAALIKAIQTGLRLTPYAAGGAYNAHTAGPHKSVKQLREEAAKQFNKIQDSMDVLHPKPQPAQPAVAPAAPGPQSSSRPYTHIYDEKLGRIVPV